MSDREHSASRSASNHSGVNNAEDEKKSKSKSREPSKSNHKSRRTRSRSPRKMSYKGSRYRSRSRSPRRRSRRTYSRSRSRSYSPRSKRDRRSSSHSPMSSRRRHLGSRENPQPSRCLGVFGLSVYTTEQELHHIFSKYGPVERVQVVIDAKTGRSRGFAFCYFESTEDAKIAKEQCSGMEFDGRRIRVDYSITQRAHTPTPGIYMGKPTYGGRDRDYSGRGGWDRRDRDDYYGGYRSSYRRSPSPYYRRSRRYDRSRSRSYSPRSQTCPCWWRCFGRFPGCPLHPLRQYSTLWH